MIKDLFISVSGVTRAGGEQCASKVKLSYSTYGDFSSSTMPSCQSYSMLGNHHRAVMQAIGIVLVYLLTHQKRSHT